MDWDGTYWCDSSGKPISDSDGKPVRTCLPCPCHGSGIPNTVEVTVHYIDVVWPDGAEQPSSCEWGGLLGPGEGGPFEFTLTSSTQSGANTRGTYVHSCQGYTSIIYLTFDSNNKLVDYSFGDDDCTVGSILWDFPETSGWSLCDIFMSGVARPCKLRVVN